jgi:hypothetical protein
MSRVLDLFFAFGFRLPHRPSQVDSNLTAVASLGSASKLLNACLSNSSLLDAYSLQESLNFTNIITVPTLPSLGAQFEFGAVANFTASVRALGACAMWSAEQSGLSIKL